MSDEKKAPFTLQDIENQIAQSTEDLRKLWKEIEDRKTAVIRTQHTIEYMKYLKENFIWEQKSGQEPAA